MKSLDLFAGAGGGVLGGKLLGWESIGYVEYESYCQQILKQRIDDGILDAAPIFGDIRAFVSEGYAEVYKGMVDVITAGFPCQPFSVAGKQAGPDDPRNMWPATLDCIRIIRPRFCLLENVAGLVTSGYFGTILGGLAECGYDCRWRILSAAELGAPHLRKRLWIVANRNDGFSVNAEREIQAGWNSADNGSESMANADDSRGPQCPEGGDQAGNGVEHRGEDLAHAEIRRQPMRGGSSGSSGHLAQCGESSISNPSRPEQGRGQQPERGQDQRDADATGHGAHGRTWWDQDPAEMGNASAIHAQGFDRGQGEMQPGEASKGPTQPELGRVVNGMANRVDRLKALGNGQVPCVAALAWQLLTRDLDNSH